MGEGVEEIVRVSQFAVRRILQNTGHNETVKSQ
jgi:hypothetical protein